MSQNLSWFTMSPSPNNQPVNSSSDGTYLYILDSYSGTVTKVLLSNPATYTNNFITSGNGTGLSYGIAVANGYVFIATPTDSIKQYNASTGALVNSNFANLGVNNTGFIYIRTDSTYLYALYGSGDIYRFNLSNGAKNPSGVWFTGVQRNAFFVDSQYIYTSTTGSNIVIAPLSNPTSITVLFSDIVTPLNISFGMTTDGLDIYTTNQGGNAVDKYNIATNTMTYNWVKSTTLNSPCGIYYVPTTQSYGPNYGYVSNFGSGVISQIELYYTPYPCFKRDTKILTNQGYVPIQKLRKGHLVKTLHDGYVPVYMMGKSVMQHNADKKRIKTQLYKCSPEKYPELTEDLILTGCHSILIEEFKSEEQRKKSAEVNHGNIYVTDGLYRLPACVDTRASVYETPGEYTIYHLALEHEDYYMNYGIYANGLLVESCSKRFLKELSNMKIVSK